ncbi:MAG TPA: hypothetical protein PK605_14615 [Ignavibacteria bacterium]|nr:hypothetical protein [Ignavibacteria bacterium]HRJ05632.1 hypothetical protein [Ignavibacteria bacterium]
MNISESSKRIVDNFTLNFKEFEKITTNEINELNSAIVKNNEIIDSHLNNFVLNIKDLKSSNDVRFNEFNQLLENHLTNLVLNIKEFKELNDFKLKELNLNLKKGLDNIDSTLKETITLE